MRSYLERYQTGEHDQVWKELLALGAQVRQEPIRTDAYAVACETMRRVSRNIEMLVPRLQTLGYRFGIWDDGQETQGYTSPLTVPGPATADGILRIEHELGVLPLSLCAFSEIVGSVDFRGHHPQWAAKYGPLDPLVVAVPFAEMEWVNYVVEVAQEALEEGEEQPYIEVAPDYYHKDNISGGPAYSIAVPDLAIDGPVLNIQYAPVRYMEAADEYFFVNYLRICLRWGGFPVFADKQREERPHAQLAYLTQDLLAF